MSPLPGNEGDFAFGGGEFKVIDDWRALAELIILRGRDRLKLSRLVQAAAASGRMLDRDTAIHNRIGLIKKHLTV